MDLLLSLDLLLEVAGKHPTFWHHLQQQGQVTGEHFRINQEKFQEICHEYFGELALGNLVHDVVRPIANLFGKDDCNGCAERQLRINAAVVQKLDKS